MANKVRGKIVKPSTAPAERKITKTKKATGTPFSAPDRVKQIKKVIKTRKSIMDELDRS